MHKGKGKDKGKQCILNQPDKSKKKTNKKVKKNYGY
jgi:hypothetical protein